MASTGAVTHTGIQTKEAVLWPWARGLVLGGPCPSLAQSSSRLLSDLLWVKEDDVFIYLLEMF